MKKLGGVLNQYKNSAGNKFVLFLLVILLEITFISFSPVLSNDFINWDNGPNLFENVHVRALTFENIKNIFREPVLKVYEPLAILSYSLEYHFFGYDPFIYHLDNLLLHLGVVALVFFFARQCGLTAWAAFFAALVFAIHPLRVESVAWVSERKDVLCAFFYMLALCAYLRYLDDRKKIFFVYSCILGLLSILAKPMALSLPLVMLLCDAFKGRRMTAQTLVEKVPVFLYVIPIAWISYSLHARVLPSSWVEGILIWIWTFGFYVYKFFFPVGVIVPYYSLPQPVSLTSWPYLAAVLFFMASIAGIFYLKNNRWLRFAFLFYFFSIFFLLRYDAGIDASLVADRFMYLPSLGFCLLLGLGMDKGVRMIPGKNIGLRVGAILILTALVLSLCVKTFLQCRVWQNSIIFWSEIIKARPDVANAYLNRGEEYYRLAKLDLALADFNQAIRIFPGYAKAYNNRGAVYAQKKMFAQARQDFQKALELNPAYSDAVRNLAQVCKDSPRAACPKTK